MNAYTSLTSHTAERADLILIADLIAPSSRVLDVGCGDGALLELLAKTKDVDGRGLELSQAGVNACVSRGLSVVQGDADKDLSSYPDRAFDYVILTQTIQATRNPKRVLQELLRIGKHVVVSLPNFGYWKVRLLLAFGGKMPVTKALDEPWFDTPNIHLCTIRDFINLCDEIDVVFEKAFARRAAGRPYIFHPPVLFANFFAEEAIFVLSRNG